MLRRLVVQSTEQELGGDGVLEDRDGFQSSDRWGGLKVWHLQRGCDEGSNK